MKIKKVIDIKSDEALTEALNHILERIYELEDKVEMLDGQVLTLDEEIHVLYEAIPGAQSQESN